MSPRVSLTGNAAHAMSPHITAGAFLGVEDVGVLRDKLSSDADLTTALKEYEADRPLAKDLDIRRLTILPGGGRTEPEYARLLAGAGFRPEPAISLARIESVIAATPAS